VLQEIVNVEQANSWDGDDGDHWTQYDEIYNGAVSRHHRHFMHAAAIRPTDRALDIGCGTGQSTRDAGRVASSGSALGVDLSSRMIDRARQRARDEGLTNVAFEQLDAQAHSFQREAFDVAISRFGAMFFSDPAAAFRSISAALRPDGRLVLLTWQPFEKNVWIRSIRDAFAAGRELPGEPSGRPGPFGLAEELHIRQVLADAGFVAVSLDEIYEPMWFGRAVEDAFAFWTSTGLDRGLLGDADEALRSRAYTSLRDLFATHKTDEGVLLDSAAWLTMARKA
jgi:ubiquinone/menaquinone biosynthesis C-methylase UbiE